MDNPTRPTGALERRRPTPSRRPARPALALLTLLAPLGLVCLSPICLTALAALSLVSLDALTAPAHASVVQALTVDQLSAEAATVVHGKVVSVRSAWNDDHTRIYTEVQVKVEAAWKGEAPAHGVVVVRQLGGSVEGLSQQVMGSPVFAVGEELVLFLVPGPQGDRAVLGMSQGKFKVEREAGEVRVSRALGDLAVASLDPTRKSAQETVPTRLADLRARVRAATGPKPRP
jgi:hypothetical protein